MIILNKKIHENLIENNDRKSGTQNEEEKKDDF